MTRDELKARLNTYRELEKERRQIVEELHRVESLMRGPRGTNLDGMPRGSGVGDPVGAVVAQHQALLDRYRDQVARLAAEQHAIEDLINSLPARARRVMRARYIKCLDWEEVCLAVGYSWSQAHNIHREALDTLLEMEAET
jgi:DNA-directed RNA polymerase specialized sigma24 family protein